MISIKRSIAVIISCIGAAGAGLMLGTGLNWWLFGLFAIIAIGASIWAARLFKAVPDVGLVSVFRCGTKVDYYQKGKPKTTPLTNDDMLYPIKVFLPLIQIGIFVAFAAFFSLGNKNSHLPDKIEMVDSSRVAGSDKLSTKE